MKNKLFSSKRLLATALCVAAINSIVIDQKTYGATPTPTVTNQGVGLSSTWQVRSSSEASGISTSVNAINFVDSSGVIKHVIADMITGENINSKFQLNAAGSDFSVLGIDYGYTRIVDLTHSFSNESLSLLEKGYIKKVML